MEVADGTPKFSDASLICRQSLPSRVVSSSRSVGWTSVLVDRHWVEPNDEPFETSATPDHTLVVMIRGEQSIEALKNGTWHSSNYRAGTTGITWGGETVRLRRRVHLGSAPFEKANLYVPPQFFEEAADHLGRSSHHVVAMPFRSSPFDDALVGHTVIALLRGMSVGACDVYAQTAMCWLAAYMVSAHEYAPDLREDPRRPGVLSDRRLDRVIEYMTSNFSDALTLERLAAEAGISKFHFTRLFRKAMGVAPHAFLLRLRLEAAKGLLRTGDFSVTEVAARCGFHGTSHFGAVFTRHVGLSPSKFRSLI